MAVPAAGVSQFDGMHFDFYSGTTTGTGSAQNIAHGLGQVPDVILWSVAISEAAGLDFTVVEGTHTATNLVFTITAGVDLKIIAW